MAPKKYIDRMSQIYERNFGCKPRTKFTSPLEKGDHPELDTSEELDQEGIKKYQSLIGVTQWLISLGRFDIATAIMTLSSFRACPRIGHLDRLKRVIGYVVKMKHATTRFRTELPDYSDVPDTHYDWEDAIYGKVEELIPENAPPPLGKPVIHTTYCDANLLHNVMTGRSVTGIIHILNKTPIEHFSKKQLTVETATFGSEFMVVRTTVEQVMAIRTTLRYLGVPIIGPTYLHGDNKSVVDSCNVPRARIHKRHIILSFHRVREAITAGIIKFVHIPGDQNPADICSKHWGYQQVWKMLKALLFWEGDTMDID